MGTIVRRYLVRGLLAVVVCLGASASPARPQDHSATQESPISVQASPQIFATMCALDAAGFDVDESTLGEMPQRLALRAKLLTMQDTAVDAVREYYRKHAVDDPAQMLSEYITLALVVGPPPQFKFRGDEDSLPPDVLGIRGFQPLLANFYQAAHLDVRWDEVEPEYEPSMERYRLALAQIVTASNAYLREIVKGSNGSTFTVYVEPFVGARTNFRNYGEEYAIVVGPKTDASEQAIQHAYLHFMLDPMVLQNQQAIQKKSALLQIAAKAPELPVEYQSDFIAFFDECIVRAVDLRVRQVAPKDLETALAADDASGFILVRPLVSQLRIFEKAEPAMSLYFPDLINGIDVAAEQARLQHIQFANGPTPEAEELSFSQADQATQLDRLLATGDREIAQKDAAGAARIFEQVVAKYPNDPRGLYGLAIASVLSGRADQAKQQFEKIVALSKESGAKGEKSVPPANSEILAWSHVYLGRIHDLEDEREGALAEYRAALAVDGAPEAARIAAENGVEAAYAPPSAGGKNQSQP
jgi:tetratricopeptide (TPR) repeat protein